MDENNKKEEDDIIKYLLTNGNHGKMHPWFAKVLICGKFGFNLQQLEDSELFDLALRTYRVVTRAELLQRQKKDDQA